MLQNGHQSSHYSILLGRDIYSYCFCYKKTKKYKTRSL